MARLASPFVTAFPGTSGVVAPAAAPERPAFPRRYRQPGIVTLLGCLWAAGALMAADRPTATPSPGRTPANAVAGTPAGELLGWSLPYRKPDGTLVAKLSGAGARPLANGAFAIRELKVELFTETGVSRALLTTPACIVRDGGKEITSPESVRIQQGDGRAQLEGTGFYLNLVTHQFVVSNRLQALVPFHLLRRPNP